MRWICLVIGMLAANPVTGGELAPESPGSQAGHITLIEENDEFQPGPTDKHYTQGLKVAYTSAPVAADSRAASLFQLTDLLWQRGGDSERRYEFSFGQSMFTPQNMRISMPNPLDRPYAGWLYGGVTLLQETDRRSLQSLELLAGVVGPAALAGPIQSSLHVWLGQRAPAGWQYELHDEAGAVLSYEHRWRLQMPLGDGIGVELIPEVGGSVGNVFTYAEAGALIRFGRKLNADYGPARIRPSLSGTTWFNPQGEIGWNLFAGVQTRYVARNIFLDGNTFHDGPSVEKRTVVTDLSAGASLFCSETLKLEFVFTERGEEFTTQNGRDRFGGINLSVRLP